MDTNLNMEKELDLDLDPVSAPEFDLNLDKKRCNACGGRLKIVRFDENHVYFKCINCGSDEQFHTFQNQEEADFYKEDAKWELFSRLNEGFIDWRATNWEQIKKDFLAFIDQHPYLENDLIFQMGVLACETNGFNQMDFAQYRDTKARFKRVDKIYKQRLKLLRAQMKNPVLSESMESYKLSRVQYVELRNQYLQTKMIYKLLWGIVKKAFK